MKSVLGCKLGTNKTNKDRDPLSQLASLDGMEIAGSAIMGFPILG